MRSAVGVLFVIASHALTIPLGASAQSATGPEYAAPATRTIVERMVEAHGGMEPWRDVGALSFHFFTKNSGNPTPWLSVETVEPSTGRAMLEWPVFESYTVWDGDEVWSVDWPYQLPPGFFARLTYSFITLPWLTQSADVLLEPAGTARLPGDETEYETVRMTFSEQSPSIPGNYYRLYIHPETHVLRAVEFDITHPGLVANPNQPLGPNLHVFEEHRETNGLLIPSYYVSYGFNERNQSSSNAVHYVFGLTTDAELDDSRMERPAEAVTDQSSLAFWSR